MKALIKQAKAATEQKKAESSSPSVLVDRFFLSSLNFPALVDFVAPLDRPAARCGALPSLHYWPDYLDKDSSDALFSLITGTPPSLRHHLRNGRWASSFPLEGRAPLWAEEILNKIKLSGLFTTDKPPNHILVNCYEPGGGISAHSDGPAYEPQAVILSLGGSARLNFYDSAERAREKPEEPIESAVLESGSLFLFSDSAYCEKVHGILNVATESADESAANWLFLHEKAAFPRKTRVSLTIRHAKFLDNKQN